MTYFGRFWKKITAITIENYVEDLKLPHHHKRPKRFEECAPLVFDSFTEDMHGMHYFEAIDLIGQTIKDRFDQPEYRVYRCLESLLLKAIKKEDCSEELKQIVSIYGFNIHDHNLQMQLKTLVLPFRLRRKLKHRHFRLHNGIWNGHVCTIFNVQCQCRSGTKVAGLTSLQADFVDKDDCPVGYSVGTTLLRWTVSALDNSDCPNPSISIKRKHTKAHLTQVSSNIVV